MSKMSLELEINDCYTPQSIVNIYHSALNIKEEKIQIYLNGVYRCVGRKLYENNCYYDKIVDRYSQFEITLVVNEELRERLKDGFVYTFYGYLNRKVKNEGFIQISFYVIEIKNEEGKLITEKQYKTFNIREEKVNKGYREVDGLIRNKIYNNTLVRIAFIFGNNGIVDKDIYKSMQNSITAYAINEYRINLSSKEEIINQIRELDEKQYDIIALSRGGGSGLEIFNDPDIAEAVLEMKTVFLTAIGHADDKVFLDEIADKKSDTPANLGDYFRRMNDDVIERQKKESEVKEQYENKITDLNDDMKNLENKFIEEINRIKEENKKKMKGMYILVAVSFILGLIFSKFILHI